MAGYAIRGFFENKIMERTGGGCPVGRIQRPTATSASTRTGNATDLDERIFKKFGDVLPK